MQTVILAALFLVGLAVSLAASDLAVITDSGSTNTAGFQLEVNRSGDAVYTVKPRRPAQMRTAQAKPGKVRIPDDVVKRFYGSLDGAKSLAELPAKGCMKSASFGTTLVVEYRGQKSPDLRCGDGGNAQVKALIDSVSEVLKACNVK